MQLTRNRHAALYGSENLIQYVHASGEYSTRGPTWLKIGWLNKMLHAAKDGSIIVYIDCDVLGEAPADFAAALDGADFAAVLNAWDTFNGGVMVWRANDKTRKAIAQIDREGPDNDRPRMEQEVVTRIVQRRLTCRYLPRNFNDYQSAKPARDLAHPIYFRAWHGCEPAEAALRIARALQ